MPDKQPIAEPQRRSFYIPHARVQKEFTKPSLTVQSSKDECDINKILAKYRPDDVLPHRTDGFYADVSEMGDYQESLHLIEKVNDVFAELPADARAALDNDPGQLMAIIDDPDALAEIGILPPGSNDAAPPSEPDAPSPAPKPAETEEDA